MTSRIRFNRGWDSESQERQRVAVLKMPNRFTAPKPADRRILPRKEIHAYPYNGHEGGDAVHVRHQLDWLVEVLGVSQWPG